MASEPHPTAVVATVHVFEGAPEETAIFPIFPGQISATIIEEILKSQEEYERRLRTLYTFRTYRFLKVFRVGQLLDPDQGTSTSLSLSFEKISDSLWVGLGFSFPKENKLPLTVQVRRMPPEGRQPLRPADILSTVSFFVRSGHTIITGSYLPSTAKKPKRAIFVALSPSFIQIRNRYDYERVFQLIKRTLSLAPISPADHVFLKDINTFFQRKFHLSPLYSGDDLTAGFPELSTGETAKTLRERKSAHPPGGETIFVAYDEPPRPIGGYKAIQDNLVYPEEDRKKGIEGLVIVQAVIGRDGEVKEVSVLKSLSPGCDRVAMEAIRKTRWKPALREGKPVTVRVSITVKFQLANPQ